MAIIDQTLHSLWLEEAKAGRPPSPRIVAELQYGLAVNWHHEEAFLRLASLIDPLSPKKHFVCREASRGSGKSTMVNFFRLYVAEYVLPFLYRPGLPVRPENRRYVIFGRDQNHLRDELLTPLRDMIIQHAPWLRTPDWKGIIGENLDDPDPEALREISEMKSKGGQKWESFRLDLANGVSFRTRTLKQSARSVHVFCADMDDILTEQTVGESPAIMALIRGAIKPAIEPGGLFLLDGTPQAPGDLFDLAKDDPDWDYEAYPAYDLDGKKGYKAKNELWLKQRWPDIKVLDQPSLWPDRLSHAYLEQERGRTRESEVKYLREYLLERSPPETALVHPDHIYAARDVTLSYHPAAQSSFYYYAGIDPSSLRKDEAGFCIGYVVEPSEAHPFGARIPAHLGKLVANPHLPDGEGEMAVIDEMNRLATTYGAYSWTVEKNGFQGVIVGLLRRLNPSIRCEVFQLAANKHTENGWLGVRTLFRNRSVRLPYATDEDKFITDEFVYQLRGLQYINGEIVEDPKRKNDLLSAFFLFTKNSDTAAPMYSASVLVSRPSAQQPAAVQLPGVFRPIDPRTPPSRGELQRVRANRGRNQNQLQTLQARMAKWTRRR